MAESTVRSPHRNPNSRSSEINNPMRRSSGGNPFAKPSIVTKQKGFNPVTPANSPSDFPRRSSVGRENVPSLLRDHEDKENGREQELKSARVRSPSVLKGTKNFMSPTISAASKVAASPKKKILAEKNESIRSSFSSTSDGKASFNTVSFSDVLEFIDAEPETDLSHGSAVAELEHNVVDTKAHLIPKVQSTPTNDSRSRPGAHVVGDDCVNLDWSSIGSIPPCSSGAILAPSDAEPLVRPYDPETNFTSPRPQFLRYRPNPRIEEYLNRERQGKGLEDSFSSESSSDETETQSEDSLKDSEDVSSGEMVNGELMKEEVSCETVQDDEVSDGTVESEEVSSGEAMRADEVSGEVTKGGEEVLHVPEANLMSKEAVKAKRVSKLHFLKKPTTVAFLLTLVLACLSISVPDSPVLGLVLKDASHSNLYVPTEFTENARAHLDRLAQSFEFWYDNSISYLSELVSKERVSQLGILKYSNLTDLYDDRYLVDGYLSFDQHDSGTEREFQDNVLEPEPMMDWERVVEVEPLEEKGHPEIEVEENDEEVLRQDDSLYEVHEKVEVAAARVLVDAVAGPEGSEFEVHDGKGEEEHNNIGQDDSLYEVHEKVEVAAARVLVDAVAGPEGSEFEIHDGKGEEEHNNILEPEVHFISEAEASETNNFEADKLQENDDVAAPNMETNSASSMSFGEEELANGPAELYKAEDIQGESGLHPVVETESAEAEESTESSKLDASAEGTGTESSEAVAFDRVRDELLRVNAPGIVLLLLALLAATIFFVYTRKQNTPALSAPIPEDQLLTKNSDSAPVIEDQLLTKMISDISLKSASASVDHSSGNWPMEVDVAGESCPSGMSSFQKSSSYSKKELKDTNEAQSQDRKPRKSYKRDSLASSDDYSVGSYSSYGSFTTYEKISAKRVNGEEITPVRRSSRIRKQVLSP